MRIEITADVNSHRSNPDYKCLLVHFEPGDAFDWEKVNWMPRFSELFEIVRALYDMDPEFQKKLKNLTLGVGDFV